MKKRIFLLMVAIGVSFAPAAFAASNDLSKIHAVWSTGQNDQWQMDVVAEQGAPQCVVAKAEKEARIEARQDRELNAAMSAKNH